MLGVRVSGLGVMVRGLWLGGSSEGSVFVLMLSSNINDLSPESKFAPLRIGLG